MSYNAFVNFTLSADLFSFNINYSISFISEAKALMLSEIEEIIMLNNSNWLRLLTE